MWFHSFAYLDYLVPLVDKICTSIGKHLACLIKKVDDLFSITFLEAQSVIFNLYTAQRQGSLNFVNNLQLQDLKADNKTLQIAVVKCRVTTIF